MTARKHGKTIDGTELKFWQGLEEPQKKLVLSLFFASPPVSLDMLTSLTGVQAVTALNLLEDLKRRRVVTEKSEYGKGYYVVTNPLFGSVIEGLAPPPFVRGVLNGVLGYYRDCLDDGAEKSLVLARVHLHLKDRSDGLPFIRDAGVILLGRGRSDEAGTYFDHIIATLSGRSLNIMEGQVFVEGVLGKLAALGHLLPLVDQIGLLEQARNVAEEHNHRELLARTLFALGQALKAAGRYSEASLQFQAGQQLVEKIADPGLLRFAALSLADFLFWKGHVSEAVQRYEDTVGNLEQFGEDESTLKASAMLGWCSVICGRVARGLGMIDAVRVKAQSLGLKEICIYADLMSALSLMEIRNVDQTEYFLDRIFALPEDVLGHYVLWAANAMRAYVLFTKGDYEGTFEYQKRAVEHSRILGWMHHRGPYNFEYLDGLEKSGFMHPEMNYDSEIRRILAWDDIYMKGVALRYRALRSLDQKRSINRVLSDLKESEICLKNAGAEIELARTRIVLGDVHLKRGELRLGQSYLEKAWSVLSPINKSLFPKDLLGFMPQEQKVELMIDRMIGISESLGTIRDRSSFLDRVINLAMDFTMAMRGAFFAVDGKGEPVIMASRNLDPLLLDSERLKPVKQVVSDTVRHGLEMIISDVKTDNPFEETLVRSGIKSLVCMPARLFGTIHGYLYLDSHMGKSPLSTSQLPYVRLLCNQIAVGFFNIETFEEMLRIKDRYEEEALFYKREMGLSVEVSQIVGQSEAIGTVMGQIAQVAPTGSAVLITGETGVGKELLAKAIHSLSARRAGPFITVNLSALPDELVASELFGHEKGAFTGAAGRSKGRFELAHGGTIFLDEIGDLPLSVQVKLLRVLQSGAFERLGSGQTIFSDFRIVAATNKDLRGEVERGRFRQDLYYRLNVFPIYMKPLRERKEDIRLLVLHFLGKFSRKMGKVFRNIPEAGMQKLMSYHWPGNVRELEHFIERAVILSDGEHVQLPKVETGGNDLLSPETVKLVPLADYEREYMEKVLASTHWRVSGPNGAAAILKVKPTTLIARMKKLGLVRSEK